MTSKNGREVTLCQNENKNYKGEIKMETYIKVKPNTDAWNLFNELWTYKEKWINNKEDIENFLGFPMSDGLYFDITQLMVERKALPEKWEDQFKKNSYPAVAKMKSKVNKEWVELCKKLELKVVKTSDVAIPLGVFGSVDKYFAPMNGEYYFQARKDVSSSWDKVDDWSKLDWAEVIKESDFLRVRAAWLEANEKNKAS
jgi:hypothetical protein